MVCLGSKPRWVCCFRDCPNTAFLTLFSNSEGYSISSKGFLSTVVDIMVISIKFKSLLVHWFLRFLCSILPSPAWPHPINIPGFYVIFFLTVSDFTFTTRCIHNWVSFLLWPSRCILPEAISNCPPCFPVVYWIPSDWEAHLLVPHLFAFSHVHGVPLVGMLEWVAISSSSGPYFARTLHNNPSILGGPTWHGL